MIKISRPDISCTEITDYPIDSRFIKLPIAPYLELVGAMEELNRPQIALINAVNSPHYRFITAALSRRLGKTYIANILGQLVTLMPGEEVLIIAPNYSLAQISFELQRRLIKHFDLEIARDNMKDKVIELENGSTIRMGSVGRVDSVVGRSYKMIIFDEAALTSTGIDAFNIQLRPTLDRPDSKAIFISTPRGLNNWFHEFYARGYSSEHSAWCSIQADYLENPRMTMEDVSEARRTMSAAEFEQEYMASFAKFSGQVFAFDVQGIEDYVANVDDMIFAGLDVGYQDPTAVCVIAYVPDGNYFHVIDEYQRAANTTREHASEIQALIDKWGIDEGIFIDHSAAQFAADLAYEYDISTIRANKNKLPGIAHVQTIVEKGRLRVAPHCKNTLAALDQYKWDKVTTKGREDTVHDDFSHMADALRYALYSYII